MTTTDVRAAVLRRAVALTAGAHATELEEIFTDDVDAWSPSLRVTNRAELAEELQARQDVFGEVLLEVGQPDVVGDRGYVEWVAAVVPTGTSTDDSSVGAGPVTVAGVTVVAFAGDRIAGLRQYWDELGLLEGLGALPDTDNDTDAAPAPDAGAAPDGGRA